MNILLAIDGSDASERAARYVVELSKQLARPPVLTVVNVSEPLLKAAASKLGRKATAEYYASNSEYAVEKTRSVLERAKLAFEEVFLVGDAAKEITKVAEARNADLIAMGSRGQTAFKGLLLGSVVSKVLARSKLPVTVIR